MPEQVEAATQEQLDQQSRELPDLIVIPSIKGEMVHLRPSVIEDLERMDAIGAYIGASGITGKDRVAARGAVHAWVRRSVAWSQGETPTESGVGDPESRRTIAWSIITEADHDGDGEIDAANSDNVIGMIFLIDIDGWARSARIQVVLGKDYRDRQALACIAFGLPCPSRTRVPCPCTSRWDSCRPVVRATPCGTLRRTVTRI